MADEKHRPLVVSGPSGSGKSTLLNRLFTEFPETFGFSVSHTTRPPRPGEEDGKQYHFVDREIFAKMVQDGKFIEHAEFGENLYGTSVEAVKKVAEAEKVAVLDVDMQGVKSVKGTDLNARFVFIKPPSVEILEERLRGRGTESEQAIKDRLALAKTELEYAEQPGSHDIIIVNDSLDEAYNRLREYVVSITSAPPMAAGSANLDGQTASAVEQVATHGGLTAPDIIPNPQISSSDATPAVPPNVAADKNADKALTKEQGKKEKEAKEKEKKDKLKEEKDKKAKEKEEKARKAKEAKNASKNNNGGTSSAGDAAVSPTPSGSKKSKTCTIL